MVVGLFFFLVLLSSSHSVPSTTLGRTGESWRQCGQLLMSPGCYLKTKYSGEFLELADTSRMDVKVSVSNGELFCRCKAVPEGKSVPFWTKVLIPLASNTDGRPDGDVSMVEAYLPLLPACADLGANGVNLTCAPQPSTRAAISQLLKVPHTSAVRLVPFEGEGVGVNPVSMECEMEANSMINLDESWRGMRDYRREEEDQARGTALVVVDLAKLRNWRSCSLRDSASFQLLTDLVHNSLTLLQEFWIDIDSCIEYVDAAISPLPLLLSLQPFAHASKLPPHNHSAHAEGDAHEILLRRTREAAADSLPTTRYASVMENSPIGTVVTIVQVEGEGMVSYSLASMNRLFTINASTGVIRTQSKIDREAVEVSMLMVIVTSHDGDVQHSLSYEISVLDDNDHTPTFQDGTYFNLSILEDAPVGDVLQLFSIIDEDTHFNSLLHCALLNNAGHTFSISASSSTSFTLSLALPLDYEIRTNYHMTLLVRDHGTPPRSSLAVVDIYITDVADNIPVFKQSSYSVQLPENTTVNSAILSLQASVADSAPLDVLEYHLVVPAGREADSVMFLVNTASGHLMLTSSLDYEESETHDLRVQARSLARPHLVSEVAVTILVTNINEHTPIFGRGRHNACAREGEPVGTYVTIATADDADSGVLGEITYSFSPMMESSISATFALDSSTGVISTRLSLRREDRRDYMLVVVGRDGGTPSCSSETNVEVLVILSNVTRTEWAQEYHAEVSEGEFMMPVFVIALPAAATTTGREQYFIQSGNVGGVFMISAGIVRVHGLLDREKRSSYELVVVVSSSTEGEREQVLETSTRLQVKVLDVNDKTPTFLSTLYRVTIPENVGEEEVLIGVSAEDGDEGVNGRVTYSFRSASDTFQIDGRSGAIMLKAGKILDYEDPSLSPSYNHTLVVMATDGGEIPMSSSTEVIIFVQDVNDNAPEFSATSLQVSVQENITMTSVLQVRAMDADSAINAQVHYELTGDVGALHVFRVSDSGRVYTTGGLDREVRSAYHLNILAIDSGTPPMMSSVALLVEVEDIIDEPPVFSQEKYSLYINSRVMSGSVLTRVSAATRDLSVNGSSLCYSVIGAGLASSLFEVDSDGNILAAVEIIPDIQAGQYKLVVRAEHLSLSSSTIVEVMISSDINAPVISPLTIYLTAYLSSLPPSITLGILSVDYPKDVPLTFSLLSSPSPDVHRHFDLQPSSGLLSIRSSASSRLHVLSVSASSSASMGVASVPVYVTILTNTTLENAVAVLFGGVSTEHFLSVHLESFLWFVSELAETSRDNVEVCGVQGFVNSDYNGGGVELMLAVRWRDIPRGYISHKALHGLLYFNKEDSPIHYDLSQDTCTADSCQNLQTCQPLLQLHPLEEATPTMMTSIVTPGVVYHSSHSFSHAHRCSCPPGYSRHDLCTSEIDECVGEGPCSFGATCVDLVADYICQCPAGTAGKNCSQLCSSPSCDPCTPNPCKYGGSCSVTFSDGYKQPVCEKCLWGDEYSASNCELWTASFTSGSFLALPILSSTTRFRMSLSFATITSGGLLFYVGRLDRRLDHVTVEVLLGQVRVSVSFGGVATVLSTGSEQRLNDGEWHSVTMEIRDRVVMLQVTNCSRARQYLIGGEYLCQLHAPLHPLDHRILEVTTPIYVGGLEPPHITSALLASLTSLTYDGCISNLSINHVLVDLNAPLRGALVTPGCPPREGGSCNGQVCSMDVCREIWNGSSCDVDQGRSIGLSEGSSLNIEGDSPFSNARFKLDVRTRSSNALLADFGGLASLALHEGSVVYSRKSTSRSPALTLVADAHIDDGLWHSLELFVNNVESFTELSIDSGRVLRHVPEKGDVLVNTLILASALPSHSDSSPSSLCLRNLVINIKSINLAQILTSPLNDFTTTNKGMVTTGCGSDANGMTCRCPGGSVRKGGWRDCLCTCFSGLVPIRGQCVMDPCHPNPCSGRGTCTISSAQEDAIFSCHCLGTYSGPLCEVEACLVGFFRSSASCQRCRCDPQGVEGAVCDRNTGACFCKSGLHLYKQSGDQQLDCKSCDCDSVGAVSPVCEGGSGQCSCRANVTGRRCDECQAGTTALDSRGCRAATVVQGSFTLADTPYQHQFGFLASFPDGIASATSLQADLEGDLYLFGLSCLFQASILYLSNESGWVGVSFSVAGYMPGSSSYRPHLSEVELARVLQVMFQSGRVGGHVVNSTSFSIKGMCPSEPASCPECGEGLLSDVLLCRATPTCAAGGDVDRDGIPDACDNCPFTFDPGQSPSMCREIEGVCLGGVASGVLWSATPESKTDIKPCPAPLIGFASRECSKFGWTMVNLIGCISAEGRGLLSQIVALEDRRQILTLSELSSIADTLRKFVGDHGNISGGDVQVAGKLLSQLVTQLEDVVAMSDDEETEDSIQRLLLGTNLLLNPVLSEQWDGVVKEVEFDSGAFLSTLEQLSRVVGASSQTLTQYSQHNILIRREPWKPIGSYDSHVTSLELQQRILSSTTIQSALPPSYVTFALLPTLGPLLPERADFNISDLTIATPILSVQAAGVSGLEVTEVDINVTLMYTRVPTRPDRVDLAVCVAWDYQGSGGWSQADCTLLRANLSSVSCHCPHLTAFAAFLPTDAYQPLLPASVVFHPSLSTYVVLAGGCVVLLLGLLFLTCLFPVQDVPTTVPKQLLTSFLLTTLLYLVAIDRVEVQVVCGVLGLVLVLVMLLPLSWLLADVVLIARFLFHPPPKKTFVIYLYIIGWALPLVCAVPVAVMAGTRQSLLLLFGHPDYCWLVWDAVWVYVAPAMLLIILYLLAFILCLCRISSLPKSLNKQEVMVALCVSIGTVVLFVLSWIFVMLALYVLRVLEHVFAFLHALTTLYLIMVHCLNQKVRRALVEKFRSPTTPPASIDVTFPSVPTQMRSELLQTHPPKHPPPSLPSFHHSTALNSAPSSMPRNSASNCDHFQHPTTLTSVPRNTPSEFDRQLASLSHQPCYNSALLGSDEGHDMATPPPHPPSPTQLLPPSPKFTVPENHTHKPWFEDPLPLGDTILDQDRSSSDEDEPTQTFPQLPIAIANYCDDHPGIFLPGSLSQINEDELGEDPDLDGKDMEDMDSREDEENSRRVRENMADQRKSWWGGEELRCREEEEGEECPRVEESHPVDYLEYTAKGDRSMGRKMEDPYWYKQRDSLLDSFEGLRGKEEEYDHTLQGESVPKQNLSTNTVGSKQTLQQLQTPPLHCDLVPLPYETAATATPTMNPNFDLMCGRPLPPTPADEVEWWSSPPPPAVNSSPVFPQGRGHTTGTSATPQLPNTASRHKLVAAMDSETMATMATVSGPRPVWLETEKRRSAPENLVQGDHEEMVPHSAMPLLPGAPPFHARDPNSGIFSPGSASFKPCTPQSVRPIPPIATHPLLKSVPSAQPCLQWAGEMPLPHLSLPHLTSNPIYQGSNADHPSEGLRRSHGEDDLERTLGKQVVRRQMDTSQTLV